ncbi:MAG: 50S ribosomal protein L5, partial [Pseudomonadota bacterium]|nr:50S ribosomal protein L5 [Pseudomonadota bacterium]
MAKDGYVPRLKEHYDSVVRASLDEKFSYANAMKTPRIDKIVINVGAGEAVGDSK